MSLVIFDMDGTLIDTHALIAEHMANAFTGRGLDAPTPASVRRIIGLSLPVAIEKLARTDDYDLILKLVEDYKGHYRAALVEHEEEREGLFPGAREALDRLSARPGTILGIATGKGLSGVERILGRHGLTGRFATLQTPDHNPSKPHPGMVLRAMKETGAAASETVMIGDTTFDIELGRNAGVRSIGVSWGYHETEELSGVGADIIIDRFDDLDAAVDQLIG